MLFWPKKLRSVYLAKGLTLFASVLVPLFVNMQLGINAVGEFSIVTATATMLCAAFYFGSAARTQHVIVRFEWFGRMYVKRMLLGSSLITATAFIASTSISNHLVEPEVSLNLSVCLALAVLYILIDGTSTYLDAKKCYANALLLNLIPPIIFFTGLLISTWIYSEDRFISASMFYMLFGSDVLLMIILLSIFFGDTRSRKVLFPRNFQNILKISKLRRLFIFEPELWRFAIRWFVSIGLGNEALGVFHWGSVLVNGIIGLLLKPLYPILITEKTLSQRFGLNDFAVIYIYLALIFTVLANGLSLFELRDYSNFCLGIACAFGLASNIASVTGITGEKVRVIDTGYIKYGFMAGILVVISFLMVIEISSYAFYLNHFIFAIFILRVGYIAFRVR